MKVYIGPYRDQYISTVKIAKWLIFWKKYDPYSQEETIHDKFSDWLQYTKDGKDTWLAKLLIKINKFLAKQERKVKIRVDHYDVWSADQTIAMLIVPILHELRHSKQGYSYIDDEDVPENIRSYNAPALTQEEICRGDYDEFAEKRWDWVLDEIIWTFEQHASDDWEEAYYSGEINLQVDSLGYLVEGPNHTFKQDYEGIKAHRTRMENGRKLFAKYYVALWT